MNTLEGAQERPDIGPHAFNGIAMNFAKAVAIRVPRPFMLAVTNGIVHTLELIVTLIFVSIHDCLGLGELMNLSAQSEAFGVFHHPQAHLTRFPSDGANDGRTVVGISAPSPLFVGPTARWVSRVKVLVTFFPPHSETFRRFLSRYLVGPLPLAGTRR